MNDEGINPAMGSESPAIYGRKQPSLEGRRFRLFLDQLFEEVGVDAHAYGAQKLVRETLFGDALKQSALSQYLRNDGVPKFADAITVEKAMQGFAKITGREVSWRFFKDPTLTNPRYREHLERPEPVTTGGAPASVRAPAPAEPAVIRVLQYAAKQNATAVELYKLIAAMKRNSLVDPTDDVLDLLFREVVRPAPDNATDEELAVNAAGLLEHGRANGRRVDQGVRPPKREPKRRGAKR
jgi:hypothetical protein